MTNPTEQASSARSSHSITDKSGIELLVEVGTLLSATSVADLDTGLDLSVVAVAAYVGGRRAELVVRPVAAPGGADSVPLANAPGAPTGPPPNLADAPGLTPGLPPASAVHQPEPPTIGTAPGLSDVQWRRLHEGRPVVDDTSLGGPAVLLPVSSKGTVTAAVRVGGLIGEAAVAANLVGGERGEVVNGVGTLIGAALARRQAIAVAEADERRAQQILDQVGSVIVHVDAVGRIGYLNPAFTELFGIPVSEMIGKGAMDRIHPDDHHVAAEHMAEGMRGQDRGQRAVRDVRFLDKDGRPHWMEVQGQALLDASGQITGFAGTLHDVTERRQETLNANAARDRAERARDRAERSNRAKSEFLSRMSHELRTPLNAILGFAQLLELVELEAEDADSLDQIVRAGRHLLAVINDALDVARIETGRLSLSVEDVHVEPVVDDCLDLMRPAAEAAGLTIGRPTMTHTGMVARADRQRLRQVLINLLSNAVKYNRPGGQVTVDFHPADDQGNRVDAPSAEWLRITIADTGIGIPADRIDEVFVPFERLGAERTGVEGTGLGLSLAKSLMDAMGARISLTSIEGIGSTFHLDLPAVAIEPGEPAFDFDRDLLGATDQATATVLYVEDNPANVTLVQRVLSRRGELHLVVAPDGAAGLRLIEELRPGLVLLDVHLPAMSGDEVLAAVRAHSDPVLRRTPIVVVTADVSGGAERRLRAAGADAFIGKPIDVKLLLAEIDHHLE